ncbi:hypothetical protein DFQ26_004856 [Actinomortierella ambigua]|nr:hypothetical protein DFQ26_004856 [Actinomortierella ambigua]
MPPRVPLIRRLFTLRTGRNIALASTTAAGLYLIDTHYNAKTVQRTSRLAFNGILIGLDYKLNFTPEKAEKIDELHQRVADRILHVCQSNGTLKALYDDASTVDFETVKSIFRKEFGKELEDMFSSFDPIPVAAASIAQVHKATLKDGTVVAVKVQKPEIPIQIEWDLWAYKYLLKIYEFVFDLPLSFSVEYTTRHLRQETDFINEARNAEICDAFLQTDKKLRQQCYVPKIFHDYSTKLVMTAEWVDGVMATDRQRIQDMHLSVKKVMDSVVDVFAHQIFVSGFVHCDPHPGNILVRQHPDNPKTHQLLLLDHGLYVRASEEFRRQYCLFWKSLFLLDQDTIKDICKKWGIGDPQMFANATLLKPYNMNRAPSIPTSSTSSLADAYELQQKMKSSLKEFLTNSELLPRELIFIGRNMSIVRANNKTLGSPVNRINRMARWAVTGLGIYWSEDAMPPGLLANLRIRSALHDRETVAPGNHLYHAHFSSSYELDTSLSSSTMAIHPSRLYHHQSFWGSLMNAIRAQIDSWWFEAALALMSLAYHVAQARAYLERHLLGRKTDGFEALMDDALRKQLEREFGIKIEGDLFDA